MVWSTLIDSVSVLKQFKWGPIYDKFFQTFVLGEALTFRATTTGVLTTLQHCVDLMSRETEQWKKQLDREKENKNKIASKYQIQTVSYGPYISYGPHKLWTVHILNVCVGCI